ncbi:MAG: hypothetical protein ABI680_01915 [Chthoniobacteraceae bacterium]
MRIDRTHIPWAAMTLFATAIATVAYLAASHEDPRQPFSLFGMDLLLPEFFRNAAHGRNTVGAKPMGLAFGIIAFGIFLFASALGIRKKKRLWPIGSVQIWLKAHIWLTTLTIPLVLFHCGFKTGGPHTTTLFWLYLIVMLSGYWGIALQQFMPRLMKENLPSEVVFEQIPNIRSKIYEDALTFRGQMAKEIATAQAKAMTNPPAEGAAESEVAVVEAVDPSSQVLVDFLDQEGLPFLRDKKARQSRLADQRVSNEVFRMLKLNVSDGFRAKVEDIQLWADEHRLMARQARLHMILHAWLIIHVPISFILVVWTFWHAYITWAYL